MVFDKGQSTERANSNEMCVRRDVRHHCSDIKHADKRRYFYVSSFHRRGEGLFRRNKINNTLPTEQLAQNARPLHSASPVRTDVLYMQGSYFSSFHYSLQCIQVANTNTTWLLIFS